MSDRPHRIKDRGKVPIGDRVVTKLVVILPPPLREQLLDLAEQREVTPSELITRLLADAIGWKDE